MTSKFKQNLQDFLAVFKGFPDYGESPIRYKLLGRNMIFLMLLVTIVPLLLMGLINYHQYQKALQQEIVTPMKVLVNKTKHSFELFLAERLSLINFIASSHSCEELSDNKILNSIFMITKKEFGGFIDMGFLDPKGVQVSYEGPYHLQGKSYADQDWYNKVRVRGNFVSDVFLGFRKVPHLVMAVERHAPGLCIGCVLRATIDTERFNNLITSMRLDPASDAFVLNREGVFQTASKYYGQVLETFPMSIPPVTYEPNVIEIKDHRGQEVLLAYTFFEQFPFILAMVKPRGILMQSWYTLKTEIFFIFLVSVLIIILVVFKLTDVLIKKLEEADLRREAAYREMQHSAKLASIGRLAAGVAHEVNNPLAVINEKAGLMQDLVEFTPNFPVKEKFHALTDAILKAVERCRTITHRLLGFARRMDVKVELLELNELLQEVLGFLEKEALHRNIEVRLQLMDNLPKIASDRGQLQQVFLNILNNAFDAMQDGGMVTITTSEPDANEVVVAIQDNGRGMSPETLAHLFEPFFTTKKGYGTGLGLSITYGIVKKLGGHINVKSQEGVGTTFTAFLPKRPPDWVGD